MSFIDSIYRIDQSVLSTLGDAVMLPDGRIVNGLFEYPTSEGSLGNLSMDYRSPSVTLSAADGYNIQQGDGLIIRDAHYTASEAFPTGDGLITIPLTEVQPDTEQGIWK